MLWPMISEKKQGRSLVAAGLSLSFFTLCSRVIGLVREMTKAAFLGTTGYADAFGIAFMIPNLFRRLFAENSISVAFIPTFRTYLVHADTEEGREAARNFVRATLTLVTFFTAVVVITGMIFTPFIIPFFYSKGGGDTVQTAKLLSETSLLTRIMFPYLFVISIAAFFQGILNGVKIFSPSGFTPVLFNGIVIVATYVLSPHMANPARAMAIGVIAGGCVQAAFQMPFVIKCGWNCGFSSLRTALTNPGTRKVLALVGPTIIGMAAYQLNDVVSTILAGKAGTGIVSSLQYSLRLQELILGIFAVSIGTVILPDLSGLAQTKKWQEFNTMLIQAIKIILLIALPTTFFSLVCGREIISLVYKSHNFDDNSVRLTLTAFRWHIAGLSFIALNRIIAPAFYAQGNTKLPTLAGIFGFIVNIALALILSRPMQGGGIALALSLASCANTFFLFYFFRKTPSVDAGRIVRNTVLYAGKIVIFSVIAALFTWLIRPLSISLCAGHGRVISYGGPLLITALTFGLTGILLLVFSKDRLTVQLKSKFVK